MVAITESNMVFGDFDDDKIFEIEKSKLHKNVGNGVKVVEFILIKDENNLTFIEAKSSSPSPISGNEENFDKYINDICDKFMHSLNLYQSAIFKRNNGHEEISENFRLLNNASIKFKFILVITYHKKEWIPPILDALKRKLIPYNKIWKSEVIVINGEDAKKFGLVKEVLLR